MFWQAAPLQVIPDADAGQVVIEVNYRVAPDNEAAFVEAMADLRRSRLRSGGFRWELYRTGEDPHEFVEVFATPSWDEHLRQHEGRLTAADKAVEDWGAGLLEEPATSRHLLPPVTLPPDDVEE